MLEAAATLKHWLMPGSVALLLVSLWLGVLGCAWTRTRTLARRWLLGAAVAYWGLATPVVSDWLVRLVAGDVRPFAGARNGALSAIVVLDGGAARYESRGMVAVAPTEPTARRALEAARVYALLDAPVVIVTGGSWHADEPSSEGAALVEVLMRCGVPKDRIILDSTSPNTRAHAVNVGRLLKARGLSRFVLVTSATHMRRAMLAFTRVGLQPIASPASMHGQERSGRAWRRWLPSPETLSVSEHAIYDAIGLAYYWARGWA